MFMYGVCLLITENTRPIILHFTLFKTSIAVLPSPFFLSQYSPHRRSFATSAYLPYEKKVVAFSTRLILIARICNPIGSHWRSFATSAYLSIFKFRNRFVNFSMIKTAEIILKLASVQLIKYSLH